MLAALVADVDVSFEVSDVSFVTGRVSFLAVRVPFSSAADVLADETLPSDAGLTDSPKATRTTMKRRKWLKTRMLYDIATSVTMKLGCVGENKDTQNGKIWVEI